MPYDIAPSSFWRFPTLRAVWDDENDWTLSSTTPSGLSISEDDKYVYVEAALPGLDVEDIDVTFEKGVVWIKGEKKEEEKGKKFYRHASRAFSYRVAIPGDLDTTKDPDASYKNGVMTVYFAKLPKSQPKKIAVKKE